MSPKSMENRSKLSHLHDNIYAKKLNHILLINAKLRKRIAALRVQNKSMSAARNAILLENIKLKNERNVIKNANNHLRALLHTGNRKLDTLKYDLQACVPALVTLSNYIPTMLNSVLEVSKLNKFSEFKTGKTERLSESVKRMATMLNMSPIVEIPEKCPMSVKKSSSPIIGQVCLKPPAEHCSEPRSETLSKTHLESHSELYLSLNDDSFGEVPSWMYSQKNQNADIDSSVTTASESWMLSESWTYSQGNQNADIDSSVTTASESTDNYSAVLGEMSTLVASPIPNEISIPGREETSTSNAVQVDIMSTSSSNSDDCERNIFHENEIHDHGTMSPDLNILKNITIRRYRRQT